MTASIAAYTYSPAGSATTGATHPAFSTTSTIGVIEQATPGTTTYARPSDPTAFYAWGSDQLAAWQTALNANAPAGVYTLSFDTTTQRLTIASTVNFRPVMVNNAGQWSGFTQSLAAGWAASWVADDPPAAFVRLLGVTVEPAEDMARVDLHKWRHGRAAAIVWGNHQIHRVVLYLSGSNARAFDPGYLMTGRVRIRQGSSNAAYSVANVGGVVDGWVIASNPPTEDGDTGDLWTVELLIGVPRV